MAIIRYLFFLFIAISILAVVIKWILLFFKRAKYEEEKAFKKFKSKILPEEKKKVKKRKTTSRRIKRS